MLLNCGVGEDSWESLDSKEIKPVNPKGNKPWIFIGRIDAEAEAPILWPPDVNSPFLEKDTDAGKNWRHEEKGTTEDKMVRWNYQFNEQEFEQTERQWRTGKPKMLQSMGSQRVRQNWAIELNWTETWLLKTIALTMRTFVGNVSAFWYLSRLVIAFCPRGKCLLISWLQSPSAVILKTKKIKSLCFHCFPIYLPWSDGTRCHDLSFVNVEF